MFLIGALIFVAFVAIWYLPLRVKHKKIHQEKKRYYVFAFLGGFAASILSVIIQLGLGILTKDIVTTGIWKEIYGFLKILLFVGFGEELSKFLFGWLVVRKVPDLSEAGCMLIMGTVGLGFETVETFFSFSNPVATLLRSVLALHIFFQLYMGKHWWMAQYERSLGNIDAYKKEKRKALLVPVLMHTVFDYPVLKVGSLASAESADVNVIFAICGALCAILFGITCVVYILRMANRTIRDEREQAALAAENGSGVARTE